jgi:hypothetical protein
MVRAGECPQIVQLKHRTELEASMTLVTHFCQKMLKLAISLLSSSSSFSYEMKEND